ncbi:MAG: methylmalonyl-CoA carboxyltransferase, partial [Micrococcales bacterium]
MSPKHTMAQRIEQLRERRTETEAGGGPKRHEKQHEQGKMTARERISELVDNGSFTEIGLFATHHATLFGMDKATMPADGVVTGTGDVLGRTVHLASQDFSVAG